MAPTKFQSTYEHVIRFKGQNIIRQYVKGTPIQWISSGDGEIQRADYLFEFNMYTA